MDIRPRAIPSLTVSATYFNIRYEDRISDSEHGSVFLIHEQRDALAPFLDYSPSPAELAEIYRIPTCSIRWTFQLLKSARSTMVGCTTSDSPRTDRRRFRGATYGLALADSELTWSLRRVQGAVNGSSALHQTTAVVSAFDEIFFPADLKLRTGVAWTKREFASGTLVNRAEQLPRTRSSSAATDVSSWTTVDVQLQYAVRSAASFWNGLTLVLNVQNVADKDPPSIDVPPDSLSFLGYDPANATARGQVSSR